MIELVLPNCHAFRSQAEALEAAMVRAWRCRRIPRTWPR
jgi:hypothetical protein